MDHQTVQDYYGKTLQSSQDLQTNACCTPGQMPDYLKAVLSKVHDEVLARYYGCGLIAPEDLRGKRILDLGCGAGRDVYALAGLVGQDGFVVGVDMTDEQLDVARAHQEHHRQAYGYDQVNTDFHKGFIEKLDELPLDPGSFDIIVSNCVINLAMDKGAVLRGVYDLLKPGGEMYFSDVYADRRIPEDLRADPVLYGECLSGALYWDDFETLARQSGFIDPRLVESRSLSIENKALIEKVDPIRFSSATYRLFKIDTLEARPQNYGLAVRYRGTIENAAQECVLDSGNIFPVAQPVIVCGNTWRMLKHSRLAAHFDFLGDFETHLGPFEQSSAELEFAGYTASEGAGGCC